MPTSDPSLPTQPSLEQMLANVESASAAYHSAVTSATALVAPQIKAASDAAALAATAKKLSDDASAAATDALAKTGPAHDALLAAVNTMVSALQAAAAAQ